MLTYSINIQINVSLQQTAWIGYQVVLAGSWRSGVLGFGVFQLHRKGTERVQLSFSMHCSYSQGQHILSKAALWYKAESSQQQISQMAPILRRTLSCIALKLVPEHPSTKGYKRYSWLHNIPSLKANTMQFLPIFWNLALQWPHASVKVQAFIASQSPEVFQWKKF